MQSLLVAGASSGIGAAVARHFASRVKLLHGVSRSPATAGVWIDADLTTDDGIEKIVRTRAGHALDAVVFCAGTWETGAFTETYDFAGGPIADIDRVIALNLVAPIKLMRALLPALERSPKPRIVLIGALSRLDNLASREVANSASKYGLRRAAHALREELAGRGVGVTVLNPGNVATEEVEADIAEGRFPPQTPIPLADLLAAVECALALSPATFASEINLVQTS
ncbi:MAG: SDR family oxidoreductase [Pseudomonadota bacterium]